MRIWTTITPTALAVLTAVTLASPVRADPAGSAGQGHPSDHRLPCAGVGTATQVPVPYPLAGPPVSGGTLDSVDVRSADDVWFTGVADDPSGIGSYIELQHYDGRSVREVDHPRLGSYWDVQNLVETGGKVSFSAPDDGWVIGSYQMTEELWVDDQAFNGSFPFHPLVQHWNGTRWITTPIAMVPNAKFGAGAPRGVLALAPDDAWLIGAHQAADSSRALIEHWDGRQWQQVDQPAADLLDSVLYAVAGTSTDDLYAVGRHVTADGTERTLVEHWDGRQWTVLPSPNPAGNHAALTVVSARTSDDVWAAGVQVPFDGGPATGLVEHWDGHRWAVVPANGAGLPYVQGIHAAGPNDVYVVGVGGQPRHWDGRTWSVLPTSTDPVFNSTDFAVDGRDQGGVWIAGYQRTWSLLSDSTQNRVLHVCR